MTTSRIIVALSVIAVLGVVAAMSALSFTAAPTAAQESTPPPPPPPLPTVTPEATPELSAEEDAEELAKTLLEGYCGSGRLDELNSVVRNTDDGEGKTLLLEWWPGPSYLDLPEDVSAYYRIQRRDADGGEWQTVETLPNIATWEGSVEVGHWLYRVGLIGLTYGEHVHECQTTKWRETEVNVLTLKEELKEVCGIIYVFYVAVTVEPSSDGLGETVTLEWGTDIDYYLHHGYYYYGYTRLPEETVGNYRVERIRDGSDEDEGNWEMVKEVSDTNTWSGFSEPGDWIYRVALVSLQAGDVVGQCEKLHWEQVEVFVPTAEERAQEEADRLVLIEQASVCALDALSDNFTPAARSVIGRYIDKRVGEIAEDSEFEWLVTMTVMFCTDREGGEKYYSYQPSRVEYILDMLFEGGYW